MSSEDICAICRDNMDPRGPENTTALECKHRFHSGCIRQWLDIVPQCPYCRAAVPVPRNPARDALEMYYLGRTVDTDYTSWAMQQAGVRSWFRAQFRNCELEPAVISEMLEDSRFFSKDDILFGVSHGLFSDDDIEYILEQEYITENELLDATRIV